MDGVVRSECDEMELQGVDGVAASRAVKSHCTAVSLTVNGQISLSHCYTRKSHCK